MKKLISLILTLMLILTSCGGSTNAGTVHRQPLMKAIKQ